MEITTKVKAEFVPSFNGNKEQPVEKQVRIVINYPSGVMIGKYQRYTADEGKITIDTDYKSVIEQCVVEVHNLAENGKKITNGKELAAARGKLIHELISEIAAEALYTTAGE